MLYPVLEAYFWKNLLNDRKRMSEKGRRIRQENWKFYDGKSISDYNAGKILFLKNQSCDDRMVLDELRIYGV
jgi:hypothetical protein